MSQPKNRSIGTLLRDDILFLAANKLKAFIPTNLSGVTSFSIPNEARTRPPSDATNSTDASAATSGGAAHHGPNAIVRLLTIRVKRNLFTWGTDIIPHANGAAFPSGPLGKITVAADALALADEVRPWLYKCTKAQKQAVETINAQGGFTSLQDYGHKLYEGDGKFRDVFLFPRGPYEGMIEKGGTDQCFAMERISCQPYSLRRLTDQAETLPFQVDDSIVDQLTGDGGASSLADLHRAGLLYYVDYRFLQRERLDEGQYTAATDAYFFVHPTTKQFLPLAIRTHALASGKLSASEAKRVTDSPPVLYTPLDPEPAWMLAKLIFNQNDLWWSSIYHLAATHEILDVVLAAAIRSFSSHHPVFAFLVRVCRKTFGVRPGFNEFIFYEGGPVDTIFPFVTGTASRFAGSLWNREKLEDGGGASRFLTSRRYYDLEQRGLVVPLKPDTGDANNDDKGGPGFPLPSFPYLEDTAPLYHEVIQVVSAFVKAFYPTDTAVCGDEEMQTWRYELNEASTTQLAGKASTEAADAGRKPSKTVRPDFPPALNTVDLVVQMLSHIIFLSSIKHNILNGSAVSQGQAVLPWHPAAFYKAIPTNKVDGAPQSLDDLLSWLPNVDQACEHVRLMCAFNRPSFKNSDDDFAHLFAPLAAPGPGRVCSDEDFLKAEGAFREKMVQRGKEVAGRKVGEEDGGMPFAWTLLDPNSLPGYAAI